MLLLSLGCQSSGERYALAGITEFEALQPITVPAGTARAKFQGGRMNAGIDPYQPHCELEISKVSEQPQQVEPDRFTVTKGATAVLSDPVARLPLAGPFVSITCGDMIFYESRYWLSSPNQPGVRTMSCRQAFNWCWGDAYHLNRERIAETLAPFFRVQ
jgi:hypothetical protein